jgi:ribonuclease HI
MISPKYHLYFDGGANPNPGPCAGAFVVYDLINKEMILEGGKYIASGTNNVGEYTGLLEGLKICLENGWKSILVQGDSNLVVQQVNKKWNVNQTHLKTLYEEIQKLIPNFDYFKLEHVYREHNKKADQLSDETLEKKISWIRF